MVDVPRTQAARVKFYASCIRELATGLFHVAANCTSKPEASGFKRMGVKKRGQGHAEWLVCAWILRSGFSGTEMVL
jgi:hypothetical protein